MFVGYNEQLVESTITKVQNSYDEILRLMIEDIQNSFINNLANYIFSEKAYNFMDTFVEAIIKEARKTTETFESIVVSINSAGAAWATETGATWSGKSFVPYGNQVLTNNLKPIREDGARGADTQSAENVASHLTNVIIPNIESALEAAKTAVSESGFIGADQQASLDMSLDSIKAALKLTINSLCSLTSIRTKETVAEYGELGKAAATAMAGGAQG